MSLNYFKFAEEMHIYCIFILITRVTPDFKYTLVCLWSKLRKKRKGESKKYYKSKKLQSKKMEQKVKKFGQGVNTPLDVT